MSHANILVEGYTIHAVPTNREDHPHSADVQDKIRHTLKLFEWQRETNGSKIDKKELEEPDKLQLFFISIRNRGKEQNRDLYCNGVFILIICLPWLVCLSAQLRNKRLEGYTRVLEIQRKSVCWRRSSY